MLTGTCGCGQSTFELSSEPMIVHCCHCKECQRQTGSAYVLNAIIEAQRVKTGGETTEHPLPTPSGKGQIITRCAVCGTAIYSSYLIRHDKLRYVRVGTLDTPEACPPDVQIFTTSKQPWVTIDPAIPSFETFYRFSEVWSDAALRRWRAVLEPGM